MTTEIYRSFEGKLGPDQRTGFTISSLEGGGLRLNTLTVYTDAIQRTYYIKPTEEYNAETNFTDSSAKEFLELVQMNVLKPYRTIEERT